MPSKLTILTELQFNKITKGSPAIYLQRFVKQCPHFLYFYLVWMFPTEAKKIKKGGTENYVYLQSLCSLIDHQNVQDYKVKGWRKYKL